jgi:hypothetical protein
MTDIYGASPSVLKAAREMSEAGYRVFPLHRIDEDKQTGVAICGCGDRRCKATGKHPMYNGWRYTPVRSEEDFELTKDAYTSGYGVLCKGLLVIDVDARNGGVLSYNRLLSACPEIAGAGMIVETGSGGGSKHLYFRVPESLSLMSSLPDLPGIDFKSSGYVVGHSSSHVSGGVYSIVVGSPDDVDAAPAKLVDLLRRPERLRAEYSGVSVDITQSDIEGMLAHISPDVGYDTWIRVGMAIHHVSGGGAFDVWDKWSARGDKYDAARMDSHWHSFGRSAAPVKIGTLIHYAQEGGWIMPVTFVADQELLDIPDLSEPVDGMPFDCTGIDITRPPGFVGELAEWIEAQSRRPRRRLAVAGALVAVGNVAGLRYSDDLDGVNTNLFAFCVAGSRTGKESILQAVLTIHRVAGCAAASHGGIKSEQEILRNLTRHQAAHYVIDEFGFLLQKISNAQRKGTTPYLEGAVGMLMSAYSKASNFLIVGGDLKEETRLHIAKELSALNRKAEENGSSGKIDTKIEQVERALNNIDKGIERPFVSLIGFSTPVTFDELADFQSATNGFIGRALIFKELDTAPLAKLNFSAPPMSDHIEATIISMYQGGDYDMMSSGRVENYAPLVRVQTDAKAASMMQKAAQWMQEQAVAHKALTGLEALYLGAYELVSKVSLILAIEGGLRTEEHVRWAFELVRQDVEAKMRLVVANDRQKDAPAMALRSAIANLIDQDDGNTIGVIFTRLRKYKREDVQKTLDAMVNEGNVQKVEVAAGYRQKATTRFKLLV